MYHSDENYWPDSKAGNSPANPERRVDGEYHFANGYTQRMYSDAHYVREEETTTPPRYYKPPEKPVKEAREPKKRKGFGLGALIVCCLVCALLGGIGAGTLVSARMDGRITALENSLAELSEKASSMVREEHSLTAEPTVTSGAGEAKANVLAASDIYDRACRQVVGITTELTYTNFFGMTSSGAVSGSGFIISDDGYILTNYHVVEAAYQRGTQATVILHDGSRYSAQIAGFEEENDVAVLKIEAETPSPAVLGNSDALLVGDTVYAVGNPLGELEFSMTTGHVSAKDRAIVTEENGESISMFQIDAAVNSGNSGGPVYNDRGEVVGIVTAKYQSGGVEGIGFAIPINDAASIARDLVTKGYVTGKAMLGVSVNQNYNEMYSQYYGWPLGAYIQEVTPGSGAEKAGIEPGDIITKFDGETITGFSDLRAAIRRHSAGDTVEVELYRADESRTVSVTLDEDIPDQAQSTRPAANQ